VLFHAAQKDPAVFALEKIKRLDWLLSQPRGGEAHVRKKLESQLQDRQEAFLSRYLDVLAFPGG
jgi:hypothetical protein